MAVDVEERTHAIQHSTCSRFDKNALGRTNHECPAGADAAHERHDEIGDAGIFFRI